MSQTVNDAAGISVSLVIAAGAEPFGPARKVYNLTDAGRATHARTKERIMKRTARIVCGIVLVAASLACIYVRDYSSIADRFPSGDWLRLVVTVIMWGSLVGGASLIAAGWVKKHKVQLDE